MFLPPHLRAHLPVTLFPRFFFAHQEKNVRHYEANIYQTDPLQFFNLSQPLSGHWEPSCYRLASPSSSRPCGHIKYLKETRDLFFILFRPHYIIIYVFFASVRKITLHNNVGTVAVPWNMNEYCFAPKWAYFPKENFFLEHFYADNNVIFSLALSFFLLIFPFP